MVWSEVRRAGSPVANMAPGPIRSVGATWVLTVVTLGLFTYFASYRMYEDVDKALASVPTMHRRQSSVVPFMLATLVFGALPATAMIKQVEGLAGHSSKTSWLWTFLLYLVLGTSAYQQARLNAIWRDIEQQRDERLRRRSSVAA